VVHINLRLPPELHKRVIRVADTYFDPPMSLNSSIIHILDDWILQVEDLTDKHVLAGRTMPKLTPDDQVELEALFTQWFAKKFEEATKK
jgi:hypothetical protein